MINNIVDLDKKVASMIIAGGQARRLGGRIKYLEKIGCKTILAKLIESLSSQSSEIALNCHRASQETVEGLSVYHDRYNFEGPLAGLLTGLEWAQSRGYQWLLSVPGDSPFIPNDMLYRLAIKMSLDDKAAIASSGEFEHSITGLWSSSLAQELKEYLSHQSHPMKMTQWLDHVKAVRVSWSVDPYDPFYNINDQKSLEQAQRIATQINQVRAGIVLVPHAYDSYPLMIETLENLKTENIKIGGLLQKGSRKAGTPSHEIVMHDLRTNEFFPIMQKTGGIPQACTVDSHQIAKASHLLTQALDDHFDLYIINKFGLLEEQGEGLSGEIFSIIAEGKPLLMTVTPQRIEALIDVMGDYCDFLSPHPETIQSWWKRQKAIQSQQPRA
jgi:molybdopterin-guanine dinucleotide biosynthesis protein A